jgi:acylphosphatase
MHNGYKSVKKFRVLRIMEYVNDLHRVAVRFEGRVQGVGFRYTAIDIAESFNITGYVRNEFDGSVSLVAEGKKEELTKFLDRLRTSFVGRYVLREDVDWSKATNQFNSFEIRF